MTAVMRRAEAVLQAEMRMRSSMRLSLASWHPDWMMNTSSSRTDSWILTLVSPLENFLTAHGTRGTFSLPTQTSKKKKNRLVVIVNVWSSPKAARPQDIGERCLPVSDCLSEFRMTVAYIVE